MLEIISFVLGPVATNTYLAADSDTGEAVIIDPAVYDLSVLEEAARKNWELRQIWVTHAHFDHFSGVGEFAKQIGSSPTIALHPADMPLWQLGGGAAWFGFKFVPPANPTLQLSHGQVLTLGTKQVEVRHVPGHSPGHVVFYCSAEGVMFCGDTIFSGSIGRSDLPGGDADLLVRGIRQHILTLPDPTRLLTGHGDETTVGEEKRWNPFLASIQPDL